MSHWTCYLTNGTAEALSLIGCDLIWGSWRAGNEPAPVIEAGASITWECEENWLGKIEGTVVYSGPLGRIAIAWSVPMFGAPIYSVDGGRTYRARRMTPASIENGGVMFAIEETLAPSAPEPAGPPPEPSAPPSVPPASNVAPGNKNTVDIKIKDHLYTNSPFERNTQHYPIAALEIIARVRASWPAIGETGARTLAAQWAHETSDGVNCWNYNIGNVKSPSAIVPHMYLRGVWELLLADEVENAIDTANGLAYVASEDDCKKHGWTHSGTQSVVVFMPPHAAARFRAFDTLDDGVEFWVHKHKGIATQRPEYLQAVQDGDTGTVAHVLKVVHYYTGNEEAYASDMKRKKEKLDPTVEQP